MVLRSSKLDLWRPAALLLGMVSLLVHPSLFFFCVYRLCRPALCIHILGSAKIRSLQTKDDKAPFFIPFPCFSERFFFRKVL